MCNLLKGATSLRHRYFVMRHGQSVPNVEGIILSRPRPGRLKKYGLTDLGARQVAESICKAKAAGWLDEKTSIWTSGLARATESAEIAHSILGSRLSVMETSGLQERWFGWLEETSNTNYQSVWNWDKNHPNRRSEYNVESANEVQQRLTGVVVNMTEQMYCDGQTILLVSHGDPLQILQTGFMKMPASAHRDLPHLEVAEIRELILKS